MICRGTGGKGGKFKKKKKLEVLGSKKGKDV